MGSCQSCGGNCAACSGCAGSLVLSEPEIEFLRKLAQIPFLPVARRTGDDKPYSPEAKGKEGSLLLQCLEKKGLISLDYDKPLKGYSCPEYDAFPLRGSLALTARGIQVVELLELQGFQIEI